MKFLFLLLTVLLCFGAAHSQIPRGVVKESLTIESKILKKDVNYTIYLPSDYETSNRRYPVVYLLHGYGDSDVGWVQYGEASLFADEAIAKRIIPPMILVMPDAGVSWFINNYNNSVRYEDFFFEEFIPFIESNYRIRTKKRFRGIAGLSMGGYGAILYSIKHPEMFSACAAFSAAIWTPEEYKNMPDKRWKHWQSVLYGKNLTGSDRVTPHLLSNNPIELIQNSDLKGIKTVRMYIDCGDDDFLYKGNSTFHIALRDLGVPHEYRVRDGRHSWTYWRSVLPEGLKFIGDSFRLK